MEGTIKSTNTSITSEVEEQEEEAIIPGVNPQAATTQADTQEETQQPESSEIEDTSIKRLIHKETKIPDLQKSRTQGMQKIELYQISMVVR